MAFGRGSGHFAHLHQFTREQQSTNVDGIESERFWLNSCKLNKIRLNSLKLP